LIVDRAFLYGKFEKRNNRFLVKARIGGVSVLAHLPNPGRMKELLHPGAKLILGRAEGGNRKTLYDVVGVVKAREKILLDTRLSNSIAEEAILTGNLVPLKGYRLLRKEFSWKSSRFDFLFGKHGSKCIVEVKASTLRRGVLALFPDAPTKRGCRHLKDLIRAKQRGYRTCILFMVHRSGDRWFAANSDTDPDFAHALSLARAAGVESYAYECRWQNRTIMVTRSIPFRR
jgi:sugar fermentation stimulation protein A